MYLKIQKASDKLYKKALHSFSKKYIQDIGKKTLSQESLIARFLIAQKIGNHYTPLIGKDGEPTYQSEKYWSLSHKNDMIFVGVSESKLGVDIEYVQERDTSLLDVFNTGEYTLLGGKNWDNFYTLWTTHEALIKYHRETNYIQGMYELRQCSQRDTTICKIEFNRVLYLLYKQEIYTVYIGNKSNYTYSLCSDILKK